MRAVRLLTLVITATTFVLLLLGGIVHTQGASLACPDWPLCYGELLPPAQAGLGGWLEQGHRLLASTVGLLAIALVAATYQKGAGHLRGQAWLGLALVILQGGWGALTVLWRLPAIISITHLATAMLFLGWAVRMLLLARAPVPLPAPAKAAADAPPRAPVALALAATYLQLLLGASVRHTQSSMACGRDLLRCAGAWLPQAGDGRQALHLTHRWGALAVGLIIIVGTVPAMGWARRHGRRLPYRLALGAHLCVLLQWGVGLAVVYTSVHLHVVTLHLGLAATLWACLVGCFIALGPAGAGAKGGLRRQRATAGASVLAAAPVGGPHGAG